MSQVLLPGATLAVLGGGQLGRMFTEAARRLGYRVHVLDPNPEGPAAQLADEVVVGGLDDPEAVERLARGADVVTLEFENVSDGALEAATAHAPLRPGLSLLHAARDRRRERATFERLGLPQHAHAILEAEADLEPARRRVPGPGVLKTALSGYDGKGQVRVERPEDLADAWAELKRVPCVLESRVEFVAEVSVVGVRGLGGETALYEPVLNHHENHILDVSVVPAPVPGAVADDAREIARKLLEGLDVVGVLCVELFLREDGGLLLNEIAPRPHNSGHLTIEAHASSQFEQQVRAISGLPLGSTERRVPAAAMANLLGDLWNDGEPDWRAALAVPGAALHLYGKVDPRPGRKMGHITATAPTAAEAEERVRRARAALGGTPANRSSSGSRTAARSSG